MSGRTSPTPPMPKMPPKQSKTSMPPRGPMPSSGLPPPRSALAASRFQRGAPGQRYPAMPMPRPTPSSSNAMPRPSMPKPSSAASGGGQTPPPPMPAPSSARSTGPSSVPSQPDSNGQQNGHSSNDSGGAPDTGGTGLSNGTDAEPSLQNGPPEDRPPSRIPRHKQTSRPPSRTNSASSVPNASSKASKAAASAADQSKPETDETDTPAPPVANREPEPEEGTAPARHRPASKPSNGPELGMALQRGPPKKASPNRPMPMTAAVAARARVGDTEPATTAPPDAQQMGQQRQRGKQKPPPPSSLPPPGSRPAAQGSKPTPAPGPTPADQRSPPPPHREGAHATQNPRRALFGRTPESKVGKAAMSRPSPSTPNTQATRDKVTKFQSTSRETLQAIAHKTEALPVDSDRLDLREQLLAYVQQQVDVTEQFGRWCDLKIKEQGKQLGQLRSELQASQKARQQAEDRAHAAERRASAAAAVNPPSDRAQDIFAKPKKPCCTGGTITTVLLVLLNIGLLAVFLHGRGLLPVQLDFLGLPSASQAPQIEALKSQNLQLHQQLEAVKAQADGARAEARKLQEQVAELSISGMGGGADGTGGNEHFVTAFRECIDKGSQQADLIDTVKSEAQTCHNELVVLQERLTSVQQQLDSEFQSIEDGCKDQIKGLRGQVETLRRQMKESREQEGCNTEDGDLSEMRVGYAAAAARLDALETKAAECHTHVGILRDRGLLTVDDEPFLDSIVTLCHVALVVVVDLAVFQAIHPRNSRFFSFLVTLVWLGGSGYAFTHTHWVLLTLTAFNAFLSLCYTVSPHLQNRTNIKTF